MIGRLPLGNDGVIQGAAGITQPGSNDRAVLILHGFGDTPQTLRYLAGHLHALGFTVRAPLLPGHGRTLAEFGVSTAETWIEAARRELTQVRSEFAFVGLVGVSMGGALSVLLSAESSPVVQPDARDGSRVLLRGPDALVLLAPYLSMRPRALRLARLHRVIGLFTEYVVSREEGSIRDPVERELNRGFGTLTPRALNQLRLLVQRARRVLPLVYQPTLVMQSTDDNRIDVQSATQAFERLGSAEKQLVWLENTGHVITVDTGRDRVLTTTGNWLLERARLAMPGSGSARNAGSASSSTPAKG